MESAINIYVRVRCKMNFIEREKTMTRAIMSASGKIKGIKNDPLSASFAGKYCKNYSWTSYESRHIP